MGAQIGHIAPDFELPDQLGFQTRFYEVFREHGAEVIGISSDNEI